MRPARAAAAVVGLLLIALLVARLPSDVFGATQTALLVASGALLLLAGASLFLVPARRLQRAIFLAPAEEGERGVFAMLPPDRMRAVLPPVAAALAALLVAALAGALRASA